VHGNNMPVDAERIGGVAVITTSFGDVRVMDAKSNVTVRNQNGKVNASGVAGAADLSTTFADIRFTGIAKGLTVHAQNSQVTGDTVGASAVIETTFGGVDVRGVKGGARVTAQNASIHLVDIGGGQRPQRNSGDRRGIVGTGDHLFERAYRGGAVAVSGQMDPAAFQALAARRCMFHHDGISWFLIHSRDPEVLAAIHRGDAFLTRLEGEWCIGP